MQWSDFFIDYVLIFLHIGAFLILTQYIKITGRKKQYKMFLVPPPPPPAPLVYLLCVSCPAVSVKGGMALEKA